MFNFFKRVFFKLKKPKNTTTYLKAYPYIYDYDWENLFQDLIDFGDRLKVIPEYYHLEDGSFIFTIYFTEYHLTHDFIIDDFYYKTNSKDNFKNYTYVKFLEEPFEVLINRVETLGGKIKIEKIRPKSQHHNFNAILKIRISTNIFNKIN